MTSTKQDIPATPEQVTFDSLKLQVESKIQLLIWRNHERVQYFSSLIGYVRDEYLLIKIPTVDDVPIPIREGERINVRVFTGVKVCAFESTVDRVFVHPLFYAHLSFPQKIEGVSLRTAMRVKANFPGRVMTSQSGKSSEQHSVVVANVSVTGALVESGDALGDKGETFDLEFALGSGDQSLRLQTTATVRNVNTRKAASAEQRTVYTYGVEFTALDATQRLMIENLTYQALIEDRQNLL